MASDTPRIPERGMVTLPDEDWEQARRRSEIIGPLAALAVVGHQAADEAAQSLGLSRRQVYILIRRARQGTGLLTDLVPGRSGGGKGKGRLPEPVERIIRELLQKRFLTKQKSSLAHRDNRKCHFNPHNTRKGNHVFWGRGNFERFHVMTQALSQTKSLT